MKQSVVWLCLAILPKQSCILEKRFFQRPVSVGIFETSMSKTWEDVRAALHRAACRCASSWGARWSCCSMAVSYLESFESMLSCTSRASSYGEELLTAGCDAASGKSEA